MRYGTRWGLNYNMALGNVHRGTNSVLFLKFANIIIWIMFCAFINFFKNFIFCYTCQCVKRSAQNLLYIQGCMEIYHLKSIKGIPTFLELRFTEKIVQIYYSHGKLECHP